MTTYDVINPYNAEPIGTFEYTSEADVQAKLALLQEGKAVLSALSAHAKSEILTRLAEALDARREEFASLITREIGKTICDSRTEMERASNTIRCAANEVRSVRGEVLDSDAYPPQRSKWGIVHRRPLGVLLAITPFNFPINLSVHKIGPAFAAGCPILFKPSPQNTLSGKLLTELCHEAGMPQQAIQYCMPDIPDITKIVGGDQVQLISFTGGVPASRAIARNAAGKKLLFELGGNDPLIVMSDGDVDLAVKTTINQRFGTAGQRCTAAKRVFVHDSVYEEYRDKLVAATKALVVGDPTNEATFVGPVVNEQAARQVEERVLAAIAAGATLLAGGSREGTLVEPTVLENVSPKSELVADETFGPVVPLFRFTDLDDAITVINGTGFGLQSGVNTNNVSTIRKLFDELEVGALAVNDGPGFRAEHFPFGGIGNSGLGREGVRYAMEEMTFLKTLIM